MMCISLARDSRHLRNLTARRCNVRCCALRGRRTQTVAGSLLFIVLIAGFSASPADGMVIPYDQVVQTMNPVAYWRHQNDATDETSNGHDGTINGTSSFVAGPGLPGISGNLAGNYNTAGSGVIDSVTVPDDNAFSFGNGTTDSPFSLSVWIQPNTTTDSFNGILGKDIAGTDREWALIMLADLTLRLFIKNNGGGDQQSVDTTFIAPTDSWTHIAVTYDGSGGVAAASGIKLWIDGSPATLTNVINGPYLAMANTSADVSIGTYFGTNFFEGLIDEAAIFDRVLSANEISALSGEAQFVPEPTTASLMLFGMGSLLVRRKRR